MFAHFAVQKDCNQFGLLPAICENSFSASLSTFGVQLMAWCRDAVAHCAFWNIPSHICSEPAVALYFTQSKSLMRQGPVTLPTPLRLCPSLTMLQPHWPCAPGTWWAYCILLLLCLIPLLGIIFLHFSTKQTPWLVSSLCSDLRLQWGLTWPSCFDTTVCLPSSPSPMLLTDPLPSSTWSTAFIILWLLREYLLCSFCCLTTPSRL